MSLQDGASKMSKSAESDLSRINLLDPPDLIAQKVKVGQPPRSACLHRPQPGAPADLAMQPVVAGVWHAAPNMLGWPWLPVVCAGVWVHRPGGSSSRGEQRR